MTTVIFIDKDGTLIEDLPYNVDPRRIRLAPGAEEALAIWAERGWPMAIITNQSGVARGYFTLEDLDAVADHLEAVISDAGAIWGGFYACPHLPEGINEYAIDCDCRKPAPGMIRDAAAKLGASPEESWFIGDTWMDMAAGCRTILVGREWRDGAAYPPEAQPDHAVPDLAAAAAITVEHASPRDEQGRAGADEEDGVEELVS